MADSNTTSAECLASWRSKDFGHNAGSAVVLDAYADGLCRLNIFGRGPMRHTMFTDRTAARAAFDTAVKELDHGN